MQKEPVVKYPKLRKKVKETKKDFSVYEPERKMLFDRIMENLKLSNRQTYLYRLIYIGVHNTPTNLPIMFGNSINTVNDYYCTANITGFLLVYNTYFLHVVEGSEDAINKHVGYLLKRYGNTKDLGEMKLLIQVSHVLRRLCNEWTTYYGVPPKLLTPLEENDGLEETARRLYTCVRQVYCLIHVYVKDAREDVDSIGAASTQDNPELDSRPSLSYSGSATRMGSITGSNFTANLRPASNASLRRLSGKNHDRYWQYLPETEVIAALLSSPYTTTMQHFHDLYMYVPQRDIYKDKVWPVPGDFIPFDVFSMPYDTVTEIPRHRGTKKKENDEYIEEMGEVINKDNAI